MNSWNSPYINHFIQPDTIISDQGNPQSWNRYSYVNNRPINFSDPTGHMMTQGDGGCTNTRDCKRNPTKQDLIASVIETGSKRKQDRSYYRQLAIELTIDAYDIKLASSDVNISAYSGPEDYLTRPGRNLGYQPGFEGTGLTSNSPGLGTNIKIGEGAFKTPGWLGSTIGHENVHLQQAVDGTYRTQDPLSAKNEVDAYNWELDNRNRFGLSLSEVERIETQKIHYMETWLLTSPTHLP